MLKISLSKLRNERFKDFFRPSTLLPLLLELFHNLNKPPQFFSATFCLKKEIMKKLCGGDCDATKSDYINTTKVALADEVFENISL